MPGHPSSQEVDPEIEFSLQDVPEGAPLGPEGKETGQAEWGEVKLNLPDPTGKLPNPQELGSQWPFRVTPSWAKVARPL